LFIYHSEKTAKKKRMLVTQEDGNTKVVRKRDGRDYYCSICGSKDATRWRKSYDSVKCKSFIIINILQLYLLNIFII
jgi:transposase